MKVTPQLATMLLTMFLGLVLAATGLTLYWWQQSLPQGLMVFGGSLFGLSLAGGICYSVIWENPK